MRRMIPVIAALILIVSTSPALAQNQQILEALRALNGMPEQFSTPAQAEATAKAFFEMVQSTSGNENAIEVLKQVKRTVPQAEWNDNCRRAENLLMHTVQQTLDGTIVETIQTRAGNKKLGSIHGYGYSGKWPIKPETQLTFDGDFDASFFGTELADTSPDKGGAIIEEVSQRLRARLGTGPADLGIVLNGYGWEGRADVYVTSAGKQWAIRQSMTRLYLIDPVTGRPVNITATPGALFAETQLRLLNKYYPGLFENGRLRENLTSEQIRRILMDDPRVGEVWKVWLSGTRYGTGQAAAGVIDFTCHVSEVAEATTTLEQRTKVAKQVARAANVFVNAMDGAKMPWREFFSEGEMQFMRDCATLDRAKITYAEAAERRVNLLRRLQGRDWSAADIEAYDRAVTESQTALNDLKAAEGRVMAQAGGEAAFVENAVKIMRRQAQVAHREFVLDVMGRPAAERARLLQQYESDLRALLDHYSKKKNVPREAIQWANEALESVKELNRVANERAAALEGFGTKIRRVWEMFNEPVNTRENVRKLLGETPIGEALLNKIPEWAFAFTRPPAITDIAFASPSKLVAEMVWTQLNQPVNALMMLDLLWQLTDIWRDNTTTEVQKLTSTGGVVAMLVVPHLYLVPMVYHASLQGDPRQLTYVMACYICPPAMLPMLVESMGGRIVAGAKQALFQKELEAMFQASAFTPEDGKEPKDWAENRDAIRYTWIALHTELDTYGREGQRSLAEYIRILASDTRSEIPLSQPKKMSGLQAIYLPGGVAKSFRAMIQDGDHKLFRENAALGSALAELQKFNCDRLVPYMDKPPAYCRYAWAESKSGIRLDLINNMFAEGEAERLQAEGKSGENIVRIVNAMLAQRAKLQDAVITQLAEAIILSFEEEKRARKIVELGLMDEMLKELLAIGQELGIRDELLAAFQEALRKQEGVKVGADELKKPEGTLSQTAKAKEQIALLADTWLKSYRQVNTTRRFLVGLAGGYGVPQSDLDRFMHGTPPLAVEPAKDAEIARVSQEVITATSKDVSAILFNFKGQSRAAHPLDAEAEGTLLQYLYTARIIELTSGITYGMVSLWTGGPGEKETPSAFADRARAELKRQLDMRHKTPFGSPPDFTPVLDRYWTLARGYAEKFAALREAYGGAFQISVEGPTDVEAMKDVTLKIVAKRQGKPADDALKNARVEWSVGQAVQNSGITWRFSPREETVMNITVTATTEIAGKKVVLGSATHRLTVKKPKDDKKDDKKDDGKDGVVPPVVPGKWKFSGTSPGNWTAGYNEKGLVMERKPAKNKFPCGESSVTAKLWAEFPVAASGKDDPKSAADCLAAAEKSFKARRQGNTPNDMAVGLFMAGGVEGANGFSLGDFQGAMADFALWMRRGSGSPWSGYTGSYFGANGNGSAVKGNMLLRFGYGVWGGGCWDNSDRAYLVTQGVAAQEEARAILASLRAGPDGEIKQEPYKGPKYDGSDLPKVTLSPPKLEKLRVGDTVQVTAEVHNDKPEDSPFTYNWGGTFDGKPEDSKKKATITIKPQKPGKYDLSVSVDGKRFGMGGASLQYEVADYRVKIERAPADTKPVPVGVKTGLKATLTVDGKPASGTFIYRWQPHPEVTFDKLDSSAPDVQAAFPKPGRVKVWVQVLEKREGREATVAESDQFEIEAIKPQLELAFTPKEPYVGQEVKAKLTVKPEVKDIDFRWMPVPGNVKQSMESKDGREITFTLKDDKPAEIHVLARVPKSGEDLGEAKGTVKAKKYAVNVSGPKAMGPKPKMWKEGVGLVDVENAIAVDQIVEFAADVQPQPQAGPVQYEWRVKSGPCRVSNPIVREARVTAGEAGTCELSVVARDRNDVELGIGAGSFSATVTRDAIQKGQQKAKDAADAKAKVQSAKDKARKGDYDGAIRDAEEAAKLDPANKEAADTARKLRQEKETIHQQLGKAKKLMDENKFADAQKELIVASNINSYYPAVQQANQELGTRWNKYNGEVRDKVYEVRSANERKDFGKALEIAAAWRASTKLDAYADKELKQQEDWARQWKAQKDRQTGILKAAGEKVRAYDYAGALKQYDEGFANGQNIYNGTEPEYKEAVELRSQAFTKNKRLQELIPWVRKAAEDKEYLTVDALQNTLKTADEAIALQPNNEQLKQWRAMIARAEKTKADNERIAQGRKYLDAAGNAERSYLTNESSIQARQLQWGEKLEEQQQLYLTTAIQNYRASLQYIPDASVEKKIKELETTLGGRKTYLENYRLSITLKNEADALVQQATKDPDIQTAAPLYDQAIAKYRKSLSLYRPFNAESIERQIWNLETGKHDRWVRKYWADGQSLEKEAKYVAALAAYDKAITSFHPTVEQKDRMWIIVHAQELRNRIAGAKNWRADGEAKQNAGKIPEAIASYRQSLKLLPDPALEEHVRMLEGKQAEAGQKKAAADRLWQEGTALFNQGRPSEALTKFKESAGLWPDAARQKYVADLEARRAKAAALREEGSKLQNQNRVPQAIAKYRESLTHWPDPQLDKHIRQLEAIIATAPTAPTGTSTSPAGPSSTAPADTGFYLVDLTPYGGKKGAPRKVKNIEVDDGSWIRLKATHEKRLRLDIPLPQRVAASAVAVVSNLDNAHNVPDKMTTTVLTVQTTSGDRVFEIKAGVHSSEWNRGETGGATHAWPKETNIGGSRWMAVFSLPAGSVVTGLRFDHRDTDKKYYHGDAAPGFCLRGITLVGSPVGTASAGTEATSTGSWTGAWRSDPGPDGEVVTFDLSQSGSRITGTFRVDVPYTAASGARQKETIRGTLEGTVSGGRVTGTFRESSDTKPAGSFEFTMAQSGNLFTALVRGEDTSDTYTVRRSGSAASSGGSVSSGQTVSRSVAAEITNRSRDYAHVFTDGETFGPGNRLAPGEKRRVAVTMKPDGSVTFKAGRNGQVLATKTWRGIAGDTSRVPVVVFDDTNPFDKLTVTTGLR